MHTEDVCYVRCLGHRPSPTLNASHVNQVARRMRSILAGMPGSPDQCWATPLGHEATAVVTSSGVPCGNGILQVEFMSEGSTSASVRLLLPFVAGFEFKRLLLPHQPPGPDPRLLPMPLAYSRLRAGDLDERDLLDPRGWSALTSCIMFLEPNTIPPYTPHLQVRTKQGLVEVYPELSV